MPKAEKLTALVHALGLDLAKARAAGHLPVALTREAWNRENGRAHAPDHRSLRSLGARLLTAAVAVDLYAQAAQEASEAQVERLCSPAQLATQARRLGLPEIVRFGDQERAEGLDQQDAVLAEHLQALVAAAYLAEGWAVACQVVARVTQLAEAVERPITSQRVEQAPEQSTASERQRRRAEEAEALVLSFLRAPKGE